MVEEKTVRVILSNGNNTVVTLSEAKKMADEAGLDLIYISDENEEYFVQEVNDREYIIEGSMNLDDLNDRLDLNLTSEEYDSLGGFIIERLDRLPEAGDSITTDDGIRLVVEKLDKNRIEIVHAYLPECTPEDSDEK